MFLDCSGMDYEPMSLKSVPLFESKNKISVNIFIAERKRISPIHLTENEREHHVNLLLLTDSAFPGKRSVDNIHHFVLIKNLSRLVNKQFSKNGRKKIFAIAAFQTCLASFACKNTRKIAKSTQNVQLDYHRERTIF